MIEKCYLYSLVNMKCGDSRCQQSVKNLEKSRILMESRVKWDVSCNEEETPPLVNQLKTTKF